MITNSSSLTFPKPDTFIATVGKLKFYSICTVFKMSGLKINSRFLKFYET